MKAVKILDFMVASIQHHRLHGSRPSNLQQCYGFTLVYLLLVIWTPTIKSTCGRWVLWCHCATSCTDTKSRNSRRGTTCKDACSGRCNNIFKNDSWYHSREYTQGAWWWVLWCHRAASCTDTIVDEAPPAKMPAAAAASSLSGTTIEAVALELPKKTEMSREMNETKEGSFFFIMPVNTYLNI